MDQRGCGRTVSTSRKHLARPAVVLLALLACLLLIPVATANASVMAKYRAKYKNKLHSLENKMDKEYDFYSASRAASQSHTDIIAMAKNDPELAKQIPQLEVAALQERSLLQEAITETRAPSRPTSRLSRPPE